jgi:hypothetical protein
MFFFFFFFFKRTFADSFSGLCTVMRNFFACLIDACPDANSGIQQAITAYAGVFEECGFTLPGAANLTGTKICVLAGDPHVLKFDRSWQDCKLLSTSETVFSDGDTNVVVASDADVSWANQALTAVRYIKVTTRSGVYELHANNTSSNFGTSSSNDIVVNKGTIVDHLKKTWIRVDRLSNGANEFWLNVIIRANPTTASGVCSTGCANGRRSLSLDELLNHATRAQHYRDAVSDCAALRDAVGNPLSGQNLANCIADIGNTGITAFGQSSVAVQTEERIDPGNGGTLVSASLLVVFLAALMVVMF